MAFQGIEVSRTPAMQSEVVRASKSTEFGRVYAVFGKRILDIILALLLMPVLLPILAVIWVVIQRDGGSAVFAQPRIGLNGRSFTCFKFRTMVVNAERVLEEMCEKDPAIAAEWHTYQKLRHDPRISKIGKVLRATSLDELPQIFNVLRGDMSLVGPRPFLPAQKAIYDAAGGKAYYHMRPGITGPWQVFGRGATTFEDRVTFDETYYSKLNFLSDLSLILRTARVVLCRTGH
jgi:lipopolysaccharide/colanic/teichoic acid biosynthesis glycosyltransferase